MTGMRGLMEMIVMSRVAALLFACALLTPVSVLAQTPPTPSAPQTTTPQPPPTVLQEPPPPPAPRAAPSNPGDPFGEETTLPEKTIIFLRGHANWDTAFDTLSDSFRTLTQYLESQKITPNGPAMTIYTQTDDTGFNFQAALPVSEPPKDPPKGDLAMGKSPAGKALKFIHRGSYDTLDSTYEAITNYLDEKRLDATDMFVEEYVTDPLKTAEDQLVINVFVPIK